MLIENSSYILGCTFTLYIPKCKPIFFT